MNRRTIKARADGGPQIGLGHWSRCLFLLNCAGDHEKTLVTLHAQDFHQSFPDSGINVTPIRKEEDFIRDVSSRDIIILDGYGFSGKYINALKEKGPFIIFIDDMIYSGLAADAIINHSEGIAPADYKGSSPYTSFFLGGRYSMVTSGFHARAAEGESRLNRLLIAMGGSDPLNYTLKVLNENHAFIDTFEHVDVILGAHYAFLDQLKKVKLPKANLHIHQNISKNEVSTIMNKAGVAILPASTMAIEYAHVKGLLAVIKTADNQEKLYRGLLQSGTALPLENVLQFQTSRLRQYDELQSRQSIIFDGLSEKRFSKLFDEFGLQQKLKLRKAAAEDCELTFSWAADDVLRAYAFSQHKISRAEHERWFEVKINSENCLYYIAEMGGKPAGSIRFDITAGDALISYLVDPSVQGLGLGRILLVTGIRKLLSEKKQVDSLTGYVMGSNVASVKIFQRTGFQAESGEPKHPDAIKFYKKIR